MGSVRTFIFHNIHHGASWIMQKLQCVSNIYNSGSSHDDGDATCESRALKITLDMRQFTWISLLSMIVYLWELSHFRIVSCSIYIYELDIGLVGKMYCIYRLLLNICSVKPIYSSFLRLMLCTAVYVVISFFPVVWLVELFLKLWTYSCINVYVCVHCMYI